MALKAPARSSLEAAEKTDRETDTHTHTHTQAGIVRRTRGWLQHSKRLHIFHYCLPLWAFGGGKVSEGFSFFPVVGREEHSERYYPDGKSVRV